MLKIQLPGSDLIIETDHGTLTENTTIEELKTIFSNKDYRTKQDDGTTSIRCMYGDSDDLLILEFNQQGKLQNITHYIQC